MNNVNIKHAVLIAEHALKKCKSIERIGIFGSVARNNSGNDLDLAIFTDTNTYLRFQECYHGIHGFLKHNDKMVPPQFLRRKLYESMLGCSPYPNGLHENVIANLDLFIWSSNFIVSPDSWQQHCEFDVFRIINNIIFYDEDSRSFSARISYF